MLFGALNVLDGTVIGLYQQSSLSLANIAE
jgi:hypothetical protein